MPVGFPVPVADGMDETVWDSSGVSVEGDSGVGSGTSGGFPEPGFEIRTGGDEEVSVGVSVSRLSFCPKRMSELPTPRRTFAKNKKSREYEDERENA